MKQEHSEDAQVLICEYIPLPGSSPATKPGFISLQLLGYLGLDVCTVSLALLSVSRCVWTQPLLGSEEHWEPICNGNLHPATQKLCPLS